ncbi:MAG: radical SAM protein, partial [Pseudomonadota bacterium]
LFAPEPTMHSADKEITELCHRLGKTRVDSDVRLDHLSKRDDSVPRVGIEGLSERLRKSVNKPYSNERIIRAVKEAIEQGRKGLFMYMILDLPGECDDDWKEFRELLSDIGRLPGSSGFLLKPSPSVFMPSPHTPMEFEAIHWERDYHGKWESFFGRGQDRQWDVMMAERSRVFSPAMRVLSMLSTRSGEEFAEIERELTRTKTIGIAGGRVKCNSERGLIRILGKFGGVEKWCGRRDETSAPWKVVTFSGPRSEGEDHPEGL